MPATDHERLQRTREAMKIARIDALICRLPENVVMLSGHWPMIGFSFLLFPQDGRPLIVLPRTEEREAGEELWEADCKSFLYGVLAAGDPYADVAAALKRFARGKNWRRVGFEAGFENVAPPWNIAEPAVPAAATKALLTDVFGSEALVDATDLLMGLRARKTPLEQEKLRMVNDISTVGLRAFQERVAVGVSGIELAAHVEQVIMTAGVRRGSGFAATARRVRAFAQVSTGSEETSLAYRPMLISTPRPMNEGDIAVLELGVVADGFWADRTRVRAAGDPSTVQRKAFDAVVAAQAAAIAAVRPGVASGEVDRAAREVIHSCGFSDDEFLHVTGHGIGFRYHEPTPLILPGGETILEEGMVHSVEPGVYNSDIGGIRVEDDVLVTESGSEVLGPCEKDCWPPRND
jgi:Xaa-Pro dipeptidase